jgi:hypothetical protein
VADLPVVAYPVGRSTALAAVLTLLAAIGWIAAFSVLFLPFAQSGQALVASILIATCVVSNVALGLFWRRQLSRVLRWDGESWWLGVPGIPLEQGGEQAEIQVRLDAQRWMLLWFATPGAPDGQRGQWLWAQASAAPARWHLLRCALYLPQSSADATLRHEPDAERA